MFSKWQVTGIQIGPVMMQSAGGQELIAIVINSTQICLYEINSGKQIYRVLMPEKEDILELYWNHSRDIIFCLFISKHLKCLHKATSVLQTNNQFVLWGDL